MQVTPFQSRVYEALCEVPEGTVTTYGALARRIGCGSAQAVGNALRNNPYAPRVPCHRVIAADLFIGGFQGKREGAAIERKKALLASEGVLFDEKGVIKDKARVWRFKKCDAPKGRKI
jgi:methylated-DNA-[protein]-cysteine S-methyltransferase